MVHIFDRHKKWQDSGNVQCLMCNSYIRSKKKKKGCEKKTKQQNPFLFGRSEDLQDNIKERIQTLRGDQNKANKKTILNEEIKEESQMLPGAD